MTWAVVLYESNRGEKPVEIFIKKQSSHTQAKILHHVNLLEQFGVQLGMPHAKLLARNIYELRIRGKEELRIFYCFHKRVIYLLHGFKKQTRKTPPKEFTIAFQRSRDVDII